jgi:hypothetical protein
MLPWCWAKPKPSIQRDGFRQNGRGLEIHPTEAARSGFGKHFAEQALARSAATASCIDIHLTKLALTRAERRDPGRSHDCIDLVHEDEKGTTAAMVVPLDVVEVRVRRPRVWLQSVFA